MVLLEFNLATIGDFSEAILCNCQNFYCQYNSSYQPRRPQSFTRRTAEKLVFKAVPFAAATMVATELKHQNRKLKTSFQLRFRHFNHGFLFFIKVRNHSTKKRTKHKSLTCEKPTYSFTNFSTLVPPLPIIRTIYIPLAKRLMSMFNSKLEVPLWPSKRVARFCPPMSNSSMVM